jgi:thiosulfate dehydrogenase [quinone] large subunit
VAAAAAIAARARARAQRGSRRVSAEEASRREVVLKGTVTAMAAVGGLVLGGLVAGAGRLAGGTKNNSGPTLPSPARSTAAPKAGPAVPSGSGARSGGAHPAGTAIGPAKDVPVGGAASFSDPRSGDPSIVLQPRTGKFLAFDAVCPHAGCTVQYDQSSALLVCPCHGSQFNAATGAVESGPSPSGLTALTIAEGGDGQLYAT